MWRLKVHCPITGKAKITKDEHNQQLMMQRRKNLQIKNENTRWLTSYSQVVTLKGKHLTRGMNISWTSGPTITYRRVGWFITIHKSLCFNLLREGESASWTKSCLKREKGCLRTSSTLSPVARTKSLPQPPPPPSASKVGWCWWRRTCWTSMTLVHPFWTMFMNSWAKGFLSS